jgi:hypothetical protein
VGVFLRTTQKKLSQNRFLSKHVCKATNISKMAGFFEQNFNFSLFYQKFIKTKFKNSKKNLVRKGLNQQKMVRDIDFRAPGGRESL